MIMGQKGVPALIHVLIVEDEKPIADLIRLSLTKEGFCCTCAQDGAQAADLLERNTYDLILLDVMLPEVDGFELMEYIRPLEIPVIFLTAKGALADRVKGLRLGAEDYIVKPFEVVELLARVDVVLRRYQKRDAVLEVGGLRIDTGSMQVWRDGEEISLTKTEYELLLLFARNPRRAMYRETIYERVWGGDYPFGSKAVDLHVQRLRRKVGWENQLKAVNKVGYRLEVGL
jgi:DNA-binding response OmpR family regulator